MELSGENIVNRRVARHHSTSIHALCLYLWRLGFLQELPARNAFSAPGTRLDKGGQARQSSPV
jgi:hypothetical protein